MYQFSDVINEIKKKKYQLCDRDLSYYFFLLYQLYDANYLFV